MVRVKTNDDFCRELNLSTASYNLIKLSSDKINKGLSLKITSIDLSSRTKEGELLKAVLDVHNEDLSAHKDLLNKKVNVSEISQVAKTGDYNDLKNKPVLPEINSGVVTITQDGIIKGTFNVNQSENTTISLDGNNEVLITKADADLSNVPNSKAILTESYVNGTSWYRVYSDGWCEQGGKVLAGTVDGAVTFLKPYVNTNYSVYITYEASAPVANYTQNYLIYGKTVSQFNWATYIFSEGNKEWAAYGYIR